jgi:hypothetical protein
MTYILFIVSMSYGITYKTFSVSEFHSKVACERALQEANTFMSVLKSDSKCIEVNTGLKPFEKGDK